jgi:hypothetical protein
MPAQTYIAIKGLTLIKVSSQAADMSISIKGGACEN